MVSARYCALADSALLRRARREPHPIPGGHRRPGGLAASATNL